MGFVDVQEGVIKTANGSETYDLILGCDGLSSIVGEAIEKSVETKPLKYELPRKGKMLYLDQDSTHEPDYMRVHKLNPVVVTMPVIDGEAEKIGAFVECRGTLDTVDRVKNYLKGAAPKLAKAVSDD